MPARKTPRRRSRLVEEPRKRRGDPVAGGSTRQPVMTAYRQQALACAMEMRAGLKDLNDKLQQEGKQPLAIGIGINTDLVVAGNMGSINRLN